MARVISVKFRTAPRAYYFDPLQEEFKAGDFVVVETIRGIEFGEVIIGNKEVPDSEVVQPLKPIQRRATERDIERNKENLDSRKELMERTEEKVRECKLQMKVTDVECTFDRKKTIVYYTADGRVDFRELVRRLAGTLGGRIEMRQIYEREDLSMKGAVGVCGIACCCTTFLENYAKSSIKMAKNQNLSLSPNSVNGYCGKPMCCLRYEDEFYQEANRRMPKIKTRVETPDGEGVVTACDVMKEKVTIRFYRDDIFTHKTYSLAELKFEGCENCGKCSGDTIVEDESLEETEQNIESNDTDTEQRLIDQEETNLPEEDIFDNNKD